MATLVLSSAGAAIGGLFGPVGVALGRAAGALAGYAIDQSLFGEKRTIEQGRLSDLDIQTSREGAPIPRSYGWTRLGGQIIWATRFREVVNKKKKKSGKGGGGRADFAQGGAPDPDKAAAAVAAVKSLLEG